MSKPNEYAPDRLKLVDRWKRNRAHTDGTDSIKSGGTTYLPKKSTMEMDDYKALLAGTEYFPAAARTLQSFAGLVFRKAPKLTAPDQLKSIASVITADGQSTEALARWAFREYAITNDGGILIDHPASSDQPLNLKQALDQDIRAYAAPYAAEAILELSYGVVGGRKRLNRVRLLDSPKLVRYLEIIGGEYVVTIYEEVGSDWIVTSQTSPKINGQALTHIPFIPLSDGDTGAAFDDLCAANGVHYITTSKLTNSMDWISNPVMIITGLAEDVELTYAAGILWRFTDPDTDVKFAEYKGDGVPTIERRLEAQEAHMAMLGSRMLASEKSAAEAAETVARRQASENSILAAMARHISEKMTGALKLVAEWLNAAPNEVSYLLSTDFVPMPIDPQLLAQCFALNQAGKLPDVAFHAILQTGEIISEDMDYETWAALNDTGALD